MEFPASISGKSVVRGLILLLVSALYAGMPACSPGKKSAAYYYEHKNDILQMRRDFEQLYRQQPFAGGFTDKSFTYYVMQIITDSVRTNYATDKQKKELWDQVIKYHYDTVKLKEMAALMKKIRCLWIGRTQYYFDETPESYTYISFKSSEKPFLEEKYYVLIFSDRYIPDSTLSDLLKQGAITRLDSMVFYSTANRFR